MPLELDFSMAIGATVSFFGLVAAVELILVPIFAEEFRQRIFEQRRQLFLFMAEGHVGPTDPAYTFLRTTMNGLLRMSERVTFTRLLYNWVLFRNRSRLFTEEIEDSIEFLPDPEARDHLSNIRAELNREILVHVLRTSVIAWVFVLALLGYAVLRAIVLRPVRRAHSFGRAVSRDVFSRMPIECMQAEAQAEAYARDAVLLAG